MALRVEALRQPPLSEEWSDCSSLASPSSPISPWRSGSRTSYCSISPEEAAAEDAKIRAAQGRSRRCGVAAESVDQCKVKDYKKPVYPKNAEAIERIRRTLLENDKMQVLLSHLDQESLNDVINAFYTEEFLEGSDIITQGETGECLYIIKDGIVDIFVARPGPDGEMDPAFKGPKVLTLGPGGLFGELALMYNSPRAATVTAASERVMTWALHVDDFKMLLAQLTQAQYDKYEGWLAEVDLLKTLNHYELSLLADALKGKNYAPGKEIIRQGEAGDKFFILESGSASAYISGPEGEYEVMAYSQVGDYFGEIALLTAEPRKATVRATGSGCSVVFLSQVQFTNLLGPISDILAEHVDQYPQYADFLQR